MTAAPDFRSACQLTGEVASRRPSKFFEALGDADQYAARLAGTGTAALLEAFATKPYTTAARLADVRRMAEESHATVIALIEDIAADLGEAERDAERHREENVGLRLRIEEVESALASAVSEAQQ